jgi:hypothetical protein
MFDANLKFVALNGSPAQATPKSWGAAVRKAEVTGAPVRLRSNIRPQFPLSPECGVCSGARRSQGRGSASPRRGRPNGPVLECDDRQSFNLARRLRRDDIEIPMLHISPFPRPCAWGPLVSSRGRRGAGPSVCAILEPFALNGPPAQGRGYGVCLWGSGRPTPSPRPLQIRRQPPVHLVIEMPAVLRLGDPVPGVGPDQQAAGDVHALESGPVL